MSAAKAITAFGCLFGAAGIVLMALAAHGEWTGINYAAVIILAHAPALIALALGIRQGLLRPVIACPATFLLIAAVLLFSADVTLNAFTGHRLFPMAAPTGGTLSIVAWLVLAVSALAAKPE